MNICSPAHNLSSLPITSGKKSGLLPRAQGHYRISLFTCNNVLESHLCVSLSLADSLFCRKLKLQCCFLQDSPSSTVGLALPLKSLTASPTLCNGHTANSVRSMCVPSSAVNSRK